MTLHISTALHRQLLRLAADDAAREICGLLMGREDVVEAIVEAVNVAADPATTFEIDPKVQIGAAKAARGGGLPVIGCFHSHPSGVARPSQRDFEMAEVDSLWLIIANGGILGWRRCESQFEAVPMRITV